MSLKILNILSVALLAGPLAIAASPASGDTLGRSVIAGAVTYCHYFPMSVGEDYVIRARIRRPGTAEVAAEFTLLAHVD